MKVAILERTHKNSLCSMRKMKIVPLEEGKKRVHLDRTKSIRFMQTRQNAVIHVNNGKFACERD